MNDPTHAEAATTEINRTELQEVLDKLAKIEGISPEELEEASAAIPAEPAVAEAALDPGLIREGEAQQDIRTLLSGMTLPQKIKVAIFGNAVCRGLLIRDANRMIQQFVLKNPKLTLPEIEDFAKNANLSDAVLRAIAANDSWTKHYAIKMNLVQNPKTPLEVSLKWLRYLSAGDVKKVARSKGVPQPLVNAARKRMADLDQRK